MIDLLKEILKDESYNDYTITFKFYSEWIDIIMSKGDLITTYSLSTILLESLGDTGLHYILKQLKYKIEQKERGI